MNTELLYDMKNPEYTKVFSEDQETEFFDFLDDMDEIDVWKDIDLGDIEVVTDMTSQTGLAVSHGGDIYPISEDSYFSVKRRALNNSEIIGKMEPGDAAEMLNMSWPYLKGKKAQILSRSDNLIGLHSGKYSPITQKDIYRHLSVYMRMDYNAVLFKGAEYTHRMTKATFEIDDVNLTKDYIEEIKNLVNSPVSVNDVKFFISLWTGDSAECSVNVFPQILVKGDCLVPFSTPMTIVHRDGATIQDVDDQLLKLYSYVQNAIDHIGRMLNIHVFNAEAAVVRVINKYRLPKKYIKPLAQNFQMSVGMSAHDIYFNMARMMEDPAFRALPIKRQIEYANNLSKVLLMTAREWETVDRPGKGLVD